MGEANEKRNRTREMRNLSLEMEKYPRDLLQRFMSNTTRGTQQQSQEEDTPTIHSDEEIELNLGLSLGGRFGVDKNDKKKLLRSSSIAGSIPIFREIGIATPTTTTNNTPAVMYPPLIRTSSLPTETEEEWRKRKELQTLRRMEAKRRRSEKQRNYISSSNASNTNPKMELSLEEEKYISVANSGGGGVGPPFGMQSWAAAARQVILGGGGLLQGLVVQPCSQGSVESQGGTSSGTSELESKPLQGSSGVGEAQSPVNNRGLQDRNSQEFTGSSGTNTNGNACRISKTETQNLSKKLDSTNSRGINTLEDMPCVFTKGDGPNGKRVDGILYKYGKGEEVRIMCVCHGSFHSPAEFVKHAGGGDVDHPLRHIVINPSAAPFA